MLLFCVCGDLGFVLVLILWVCVVAYLDCFGVPAEDCCAVFSCWIGWCLLLWWVLLNGCYGCVVCCFVVVIVVLWFTWLLVFVGLVFC